MVKRKVTAPVKGTTQQFVEIDEVKDDVLILKDRSAVIVIEIGAVNFWLLSQEEQTSTIYSYGALLNSLSFPVQIVILSKRMDISNYLEYVKGKIITQQNDVLKNRLEKYSNFIQNIVKKNTVLEKRFFFVVPFSPLELGPSGLQANKINKEYLISRAKTSLYPKRDHLLRLLTKLGLKTTILFEQQLVEFFYNVYNPSSTGKRLAPIDSYTDVVMSNA